MNNDEQILDVQEDIVLDKYEGEPSPENLVEKVYIHNGRIWKHEFYEHGAVVDTKEVT